MTEAFKSPTTPLLAPAQPSADTGAAGAMLRTARQQQGLHIAALAAAIKVPPAKLEALEAGRYHELLDVTFTRALAQAVCRVLKIDPVPVLALMPGAPPDALGRVDGGLNTPFRERPGRVMAVDWVPWRHPVLWLVALLLLAAAAFVLVPASALRDSAAVPGLGAPVMPPAAVASAPGAVDAPSLPASAAMSSALPAPLPGLVAQAPGLAASVPLGLVDKPEAPVMVSAAPVNADGLVLRAIQSTWVQVVDGNGQTLMARVVPAGETVALTATPPLKLRIGNAAGTELAYRGKPVVLPPTRDNIVNLTLP